MRACARLSASSGPRGALAGRREHAVRVLSLRCVCSAAAPRSVLVVGGGAAGLTAAFFAAGAGARVTVLERNGETGKKILMSGGTRANVLPLSFDTESYFFTDSSRSALRQLLLSWPLDDVRAWLTDALGVQLALEESTGKWCGAERRVACPLCIL